MRGEVASFRLADNFSPGLLTTASQRPDRETEHLAVWQNGKVQDLGTLGGADWYDPAAINNRGEVTGTFGPYAMGPGDVSPDSIFLFFWSSGKMHDLGSDGEAAALNNLGQVVGWKTWPDGQHGFVYQGGTTREIKNPLGRGISAVVAINDRGQMVQVAFDAGGANARVHAFLLNGNSVTELNPPLGHSLSFYSRPVLTSAGQVIFKDSAGVGTLPGFPHTDIVATNTQGVSVGSASEDDALLGHLKYRAVVWQSGSLYDLNDLVPRHAGVLEQAVGLNSHGQIIGSGEDAHGRFQGFLLTPITK